MEIEWTLALTCVLYRENILHAVEKQRRTLFLPWSVTKRFDASSKSGRGLPHSKTWRNAHALGH